MTTLRDLSSVDQVAPGDSAVIHSQENGDARRASMAVIATFIQTLITSTDDKVTQYASPSATGFNITLTNDSNSKWLVLTPTAGGASGTITFPAVAICVDRQEVIVNSTQSVTTLTVAGNGATVTGAPTTLAANAFFRMRFEGVTKTWYRVG